MGMRVAKCRLASAAPYSQSKAFSSDKLRDETHADYEERCWRERCHVDGKGQVYIPPTAFKNCLAEAAKYKSVQIPGKGKSTYTKHFEAGVLVTEPLYLGIHIDDIKAERLFVPADGRRGSGKRVNKLFPLIHQWAGEVKFLVVDDIIDEEVFATHLTDAGQFIGVGRFRPRNNGFYGRFTVEGIEWA